MSLSKSEKYTLSEKPSTAVRQILKEYPEFVQDLLVARNIMTVESAKDFFNPNYNTHVHDPFLMRDMDTAVERIIAAIDAQEHIAIYSDFDADGIPGGALLHDVFKKVGLKRFTNYIPHRDTEGYGFHKEAVDVLAKKKVTLIITVDVGTANPETVDHANTLGIDVIVTDHHLTQGVLPNAVAVINPQREDETYPFRHLCGTGVAFKLVQAILIRAREQKKKWVQDIPEGWEKWLLDLVAIATVADMMPLVGENRALVHYGLLVLRKSRRPGIGALCRKAGLQQSFLSEGDIGFTIGPRLNAASRMGSPEVGLTLLTTQDAGTAADAAKELHSLNNKRKGQVASIVRELKKRFDEDSSGNVLVAGNPNWNPALVGLAANSLVDTYGKTVCLWGKEGTGDIKGSCRGNGSVNIVEMFSATEGALAKFGGHEHAGGFSVEHEKIHTLHEVLNVAYAEVSSKVEKSIVNVDATLSHGDAQNVNRTLESFAPFGIENPKPIFLCPNVIVRSAKQFGKEELHFEMHIAEKDAPKTLRAIAFFKNAESFSTHPALDKVVDVLCTLELSRFAGRVNLELRIVDIV